MNIFGPIWAGLVYDNVMRGSPYWMGDIIYILAAFLLFRTAPRAQTSNLNAGIIE